MEMVGYEVNFFEVNDKYLSCIDHIIVAHCFPRASLSENCSLLGTDNVRGQISEHIFAPNGDYCI